MPDRLTLDTSKFGTLMTSPDTSGFVLLLLCLYTLGESFFEDEEGEPTPIEEVLAEMQEAHGEWMCEEGENRLQALLAGLDGGAFFRDLPVFRAVSVALLDGDLGDMLTDVMSEEPTVEECMWATHELSLALKSVGEEPPEFAPKVEDYINSLMRRESVDYEELQEQMQNEHDFMLTQLVELGVTADRIREIDQDYADNLEVIDELAAI